LCTSLVELLIDNGANVNTKNLLGETPLYLTTESGSLEISKILLNNGADVAIKNNNGNTPLHHAVWHPHKPELTKLLIDNGAEVSATDNEGFTPLHIAVAYRENISITELLILNGADVNANEGGFNPLKVALDYNNHNIAELLRKHGAIE
jgi:ankyrin repeat protein